MTDNHGYNTPARGSTDWNIPLNSNFEALDGDVPIRDVESNLSQYVPKEGAEFTATDSKRVFHGDGEQWNLFVDLSAIGSGGGEGAISGYTPTYPATGDGETKHFVFQHGYPETPGQVIPIPQTNPSYGAYVSGISSTRIRISQGAAQGTSENPVDLQWGTVFVGTGGGFGFGPTSIDDFEYDSQDAFRSNYTGDLGTVGEVGAFEIDTSRAFEGDGSLRVNGLGERMILTNETYAGRDRTYRVATDGTGFGSYGKFVIFASGSGADDVSGYMVETDTEHNSFGLYRCYGGVDGNSRDPIVGPLDVQYPEGWFIPEIEPLSDGTVTARVVSPSGETLVEGNGDEGALSSGKAAFGGDPSTSDDIYVNFDGAESEVL